MDETGGKRIGKYRNAVLLAQGATGAIYKAHHPTLEQPVVIKMLSLSGSEQVALRFQQEAAIMMGFQHVNIVNYFDHFQTTRSYCMVMEYIDGCSLSGLLDTHGFLSDEAALLVVRDTLRALEFAHGKGVIHRDIKPANILISSRGDVKLTDFGIARNPAAAADIVSRKGATLGTPAYMAPEQFRDAASVDARADIYSVGVVLYECLTGKKPFSGMELPKTPEELRKRRYERLNKLRPHSRFISRTLVRRAMRYRPEMRFRDAAGMLRRVERFFSRRGETLVRAALADLVNNRDSGGGVPLRTRRRVLRGVIFGLGGAGAVLAAGALWLSLSLKGQLPVFLLPDSLGAVRAEVSAPAAEEFIPPVHLEVYRMTANSPDIKTGSREGRRAGPLLVQTRPLIVRPGSYACALSVGDAVYNHVVQIPSLRDCRQSPSGQNSAQVVLRKTWVPSRRKVRVSWELLRGDSGMELAPSAPPEVTDDKGRIQKNVRYGSADLTAGSSYRLKFSHPGFSSQTVRVSLEDSVSDYDITVVLMPEKAVLELSSDVPLRRPWINGDHYYPNAGEAGGFQKMPVLKKTAARLELFPGTYTLVADRGGKSLSREVLMQPGETKQLHLTKDKEGNLRWIERNAAR